MDNVFLSRFKIRRVFLQIMFVYAEEKKTTLEAKQSGKEKAASNCYSVILMVEAADLNGILKYSQGC